MVFVVITGPSGAGKTLALHSFEDIGFSAVDNLAPPLLPALAKFARDNRIEKTAVVSDMRSGDSFSHLPDVIEAMRADGIPLEVLFLDAGDGALVQRFKETRRPHPMIRHGVRSAAGIMEAIRQERVLLSVARAVADKTLDTSSMTAVQLREAVHASYGQGSRPGMLITLMSFGFKYGIPIDADLVIDVRFLANPHYVADLKYLDGRDDRVAAYVEADPLTAPFLAKILDLVEFTLPQYEREGKAYLTIAVGCTGGKHRSVVLTRALAESLRKSDYLVAITHRDIERDRKSVTVVADEAYGYPGSQVFQRGEEKADEQP